MNYADAWYSLKQLDDVRRNLSVLIVEGFDENTGYSKEIIKAFEKCYEDFGNALKELKGAIDDGRTSKN